MTRILTLSLLTLISLSGLSKVHAESTVPAKDNVSISTVRPELLKVVQPNDDAQNGKDEVPRPKPKPGPREGGEE